MNVIYSKYNTHIEDSYLITDKREIEKELDYIIEVRKGMKYPTRSLKSYTREWLGHNNLYNIGLFRSHTASVDLNENNSIIEELIWLIIGR